jgi:mRNA interferase RelE/StbE
MIPKEQERIKAALRRLALEPRGSDTKKLRGTDLFRLRTGRYRIIYGIRDEQLIIVVLEIMHRSQDYESLDTLVRRWRNLLREP